jgi:hypothetical protein
MPFGAVRSQVAPVEGSGKPGCVVAVDNIPFRRNMLRFIQQLDEQRTADAKESKAVIASKTRQVTRTAERKLQDDMGATNNLVYGAGLL